MLPGLWDLHVHLIYNGHPNPGAWFTHAAEFESTTVPASARQMLMAGVTSVRDLAAPADAILGVKRRIAGGMLPGPTIYAAGPALAKLAPDQTSITSQFQPIDGADDARAKTRQLIDAGVDVVKIFFADRMSPEERAAIVGEAHARGQKVAMHGQNDAEVRLGLEMGIDDFQHIGIDSPEYAPDIMAALRARVKRGPPLYWTPTVGANGLLNADYFATKPEIIDDPENFLGLPALSSRRSKPGWSAYQPRGRAPTPRPSSGGRSRRCRRQAWDRLRQRRGQRGTVRPALHVDGRGHLGARARHGSDGVLRTHDARRRARHGRGSRLGR